MESILTSIKKLLGIAEDYTHFDEDVIMHINTVFMDLTGLKVGPSSGFIITDKSAVWTDFVSNPKSLAAIKSYMYLRVKLLFDPPTNASLLNSMQQQIEKFEWLINVAAENDRSGIVDEGVSEEIKALIAELESENETLKSLNAELTATNETLTANNSSLSSTVSSLEKSNASLQNSVDTLTDANDALQVDNSDLRIANESLQTRNSDLEFQNGELSARNETLLTENESLESANETLSTKNAELEAENERLEASIKPEQRKTVEITENGTTEILPDEGNTLSGVDLTVNVPSSGGTEELENLIDESGVLDSTDGTVTVTDKVKRLIHATDLFYKLYLVSFYGIHSVERVEIYIDWAAKVDFSYARGLKFLRGIDVTKLSTCREMLMNCNVLETIEIPFDMSKHNAYHMNAMFTGCVSLVDVRFVAETIKASITIPSPVLSDESIQSIIDGLATVETTQTLTLHSDVYSKITDAQWAIIESKNWRVE